MKANEVETNMPENRIEIDTAFVFGNFVISNSEAPNAVAPRLDWGEPSYIMQGGEPNLFLALQWRYNLAPTLRGRDRELQSLMEWAEDGESNIQIRLLTGGGGSGKTRLAATAARELRTRGWAAGFLPRDADATHVIISPKGETLRKLFLIMDYPEERMNVVEKLIRAVSDISDTLVDFPIRILLVSRRGLDGWQQIMDHMGYRAGRQELAELDALSVDQAHALFVETASAFAQLTGKSQPDLVGVRDWLSADKGHRVPLVSMAAAIHQVITGDSGFGLGAHGVITALAKFECVRAKKVSRDQDLGEMAIPRLLALAAMSSDGLSDDQCIQLAGLGVGEQSNQKFIDRLANTPWHHRKEDGTGYITRPEPDRMAAVFMGLILLDRVESKLPEWIAVTVEPDAEQFGANLNRIGFDLISAPPAWSQRLEKTLAKMIEASPARVVHFMGMAMQEAGVFSARFATVILQTLLNAGVGEPRTRGSLLHSLSGHLAKIGRHEEALDAAEKAVRIYRNSTKSRPSSPNPGLAGSLNNLANGLFELGRQEEALVAVQEVVEIYRDLAKSWPDAYTPELAMSLNNAANRFSDMGHREEALAAAQESVKIYGELAKSRPEAFIPNLARSFNNVATKLSESGHHEEALEAAHKAVRIYRDLAKSKPDAFFPDLALSLNTVANRLSNVGGREEALGAAQESVKIYRELATSQPDAFNPDLAMSVNTLATMLSLMDRCEEALKAFQESIAIRQELAKSRPDVFIPKLAMSLNNLATTLAKLDRREEALEAAQEAVKIYREFAKSMPDAFKPDLAGSLNNVANRLSELGCRKEALKAAQDAVAIRRELAKSQPQAFTFKLVISLNTLAITLFELGRREEALEAAREAVRIYRDLVKSQSDAFTPDLAGSLNNVAVVLSALGRREEALEVAQEAVGICRELAKSQSDSFTLDLARSLNTLADTLFKLNRRAEALEAAQEAVTKLGPQFLDSPVAFKSCMGAMVQTYIERCEDAKTEPDRQLLLPILATFEKFNSQPK